MQTICCAVPLYDSLGEGSVEYITHHAHLKVIFASASKMMLLKKSLPKLKGYTKVIVYFGEVDESSPKAASDQVRQERSMRGCTMFNIVMEAIIAGAVVCQGKKARLTEALLPASKNMCSR